MSNRPFPFWQELRKLLVDRLDGTFAERVEAYPPKVLMTDSDGPYARLRVDTGQTSFWAGREFRILYEYSVAAGASVYLKLDTTAVDCIVQILNASIWDGSVRVDATIGGTEGTAFATPLAQRRTNNMSTADFTYTSQVAVQSGGTVTGGTLLEVTELDAAVGSGHHHESVVDASPLGAAKALYYFKITNTGAGTARGAIRVRWEERP